MKVRGTGKRDKEIGAAINMHRITQGLTRQELAGKIGVTHQQLQKYEKGANRITVTRLEAIADALGVPFDTLRGTGDVCKEELGRLDLEHMKAFRAIPGQRQRVAVHKLVTAMVLGEAGDAASGARV